MRSIHQTLEFDNVLFVGTVNTDESTYQFSDKVLDRIKRNDTENDSSGSIDETVGSPVERSKREVIKASDFQKMKKVNTEAKLTSDEKNMLWEIHKALNNVDAKYWYRMAQVRQIDKYLMNIPDDIDSYTREKKAFDMQIIQRVLTKVRGSEDQMRALVGKDTAGSGNMSLEN